MNIAFILVETFNVNMYYNDRSQTDRINIMKKIIYQWLTENR